MRANPIICAIAFMASCKADRSAVEPPRDEAARVILGDKQSSSTVANLRATLLALDTALDEARARSALRPDAALDKQLAAIATKLDVRFELVARARPLDTSVGAEIIGFYAGVAELKGMLDTHVRSAKADDQAFATARQKTEAAARYAVLIDAEHPGAADGPVGAKLVELGPPFCGAKLATTAVCPDDAPATGFAYRGEPGAAWQKGELASPGTDAVPAKKLVPLLPNGIRDSLIAGADGVASELMYAKRLRAIGDRLKSLLDAGGHLEATLAREASR